MLLLLIITTNFRIMNTLQKTLIHFGLTEADTKVYLTLNQRGESDISTLLKETKLSRTAIYDSINSLTEMKLLTHRKVGKTAYYNITHPQQLEQLLNEKKMAEANQERNFQASIASLTEMYELVSDQPGLYSFAGKEGIIKVYEELLADGQNIDSIEDKGEMKNFIPQYSAVEFPRKRIQHNIFNRVIAPAINTINPTNPAQLRETHFVDPELFPFGMDIKMNNKKVVMVTFQKDTAIGVVIIHPVIVKNFQVLFNWLWHMSALPG